MTAAPEPSGWHRGDAGVTPWQAGAARSAGVLSGPAADATAGATTAGTRSHEAVGRRRQPGLDAGGQASVELVLVLPLVVLLLVALLQAGVLVRDQLLVVQAAREGAREAAVSPLADRIGRAARRAAPGLGVDVRVQRGPRTGDLAAVTVAAHPTRLPFVGRILGGRRIEASATMRIERAGP